MPTEEHEEEMEALKSIFDGDPAFKILSDNSIQVMMGEEGSTESFLLQLDWPDSYPSSSGPDVVLDLFYNSKLHQKAKEGIRAAVAREAESLLGMGMTFSLIETLKENLSDLLQPHIDALNEIPEDNNEPEDAGDSSSSDDVSGPRKEKKSGMTKTQKRRMWDKGGEDRERGWDWVCIIRHLSQTGGKPLT